MFRFKDLKIGFRLNLIFSVVIVVIISTLGLFFYNNSKTRTINDTDLRMYEQLDDLVHMLDIQIVESRKKVKIAQEVASEMLNAKGVLSFSEDPIQISAVNQQNNQRNNIELFPLVIDNQIIYQNNELVDKISGLTDATSTIFQKIPGGYLRISTNVLNASGERAIGTYIPNGSPVVSAIENGQTYTGRAFVVDDYYLTSYEPIRVDGEIVGMLYVGVHEKDMATLKPIFEEKVYFEKGYPFVVASDGTFIIHPTREGDNASEYTFFNQLKTAQSDRGKTYYKWPETEEGQWKFQYFQYYEPIDAYIAASFYEETLFEFLSNIRNTVIIGVLLSVGIFVIIVTFFARSLSSAINKGVRFAENVAHGDLTQNIDIDQKDEIGVLSAALNQMVVKLKSIVENVEAGADNIASASQQMSSSSQQMSQGASEQASSAEEVSSSMEEMASNIQQNTDNAQQTEKISEKAVDGMRKITVSATENSNSIKEIAEKITIIDDIAFQTNILALNAAVEAARAGEHGKGFAVVAAEVRKLAERSKVAADEIDVLSKSSVQVNDQVAKLMDEIVPEIEKTARLVQEISAASLEQNSGADQVNSAIQQLNQVTQQNAASSEELATSSEELASQAEQLKSVIGFFNIGTTRNKSATVKRTITRKVETVKPKQVPESKQEDNSGIDLNMLDGKKGKDNDYESF